MDFGHPLEFGYFLVPDADDPREGLETARLVLKHADLLGLPEDHAEQSERVARRGVVTRTV